MSKRGFTLVELLAVIVILAIVLAIAVPAISNMLRNATRSAFESDAKMVIEAAKYKQLEDSTFDPLTVTKDNIKDKLGLNGDNYQQLNFEMIDDKLNVSIVGTGKWNGFTAYGTIQNMKVVSSSDYDVSPPVITIANDPENVYQGSVFTDSGVSATDIHDGSVAITSVIKNNSGTVVPSIDTSTLTTYTITYTSKDSAGNEATPVTRTINIVKLNNAPVLATGMTPIKWDGSSWVDTTSSDTSWYNYDAANKKWANARTADGSMWVWIPRYIYKISSGWHTSTTGTIDIQFSQGTDDNWNSPTIGNINTDPTSNSSNNKWTNHPAFTFGTTQLTGIWVAKFEASPPSGSACYTTSNPTNCNITTILPKVLPAAHNWIYISIGNAFTVVKSMETDNTYGWGTTGNNIDTHLMKNTEWGVVAYLSRSTYGKYAEIWNNNSATHITGCAGSSASAAQYSGCENAYDTTNGLQASTTGNIYGIYDISGGSWEFTSAYVNNGDSNLSTNGSSLVSADAKYKNLYSVGTTDVNTDNYDLTINSKGDALYETSSNGTDSASSWFGDYSYMPSTTNPCFMRGGSFGSTTLTGEGAFSFTYSPGYAAISFRPILLVGAGL